MTNRLYLRDPILRLNSTFGMNRCPPHPPEENQALIKAAMKVFEAVFADPDRLAAANRSMVEDIGKHVFPTKDKRN